MVHKGRQSTDARPQIPGSNPTYAPDIQMDISTV